MKKTAGILFLALLFLFSSLAVSAGEDMREVQIRARQEKQMLLEKARQEKAAAEKEAAEAREQILQDRETLENAIAELEKNNRRHEERIDNLASESLKAFRKRKTSWTRRSAKPTAWSANWLAPSGSMPRIWPRFSTTVSSMHLHRKKPFLLKTSPARGSFPAWRTSG
jgi:hypothetical protein